MNRRPCSVMPASRSSSRYRITPSVMRSQEAESQREVSANMLSILVKCAHVSLESTVREPGEARCRCERVDTKIAFGDAASTMRSRNPTGDKSMLMSFSSGPARQHPWISVNSSAFSQRNAYVRMHAAQHVMTSTGHMYSTSYFFPFWRSSLTKGQSAPS